MFFVLCTTYEQHLHGAPPLLQELGPQLSKVQHLPQHNGGHQAVLLFHHGGAEYCIVDMLIISLTERSYYNTAMEKSWPSIPNNCRDEM